MFPLYTKTFGGKTWRNLHSVSPDNNFGKKFKMASLTISRQKHFKHNFVQKQTECESRFNHENLWPVFRVFYLFVRGYVKDTSSRILRPFCTRPKLGRKYSICTRIWYRTIIVKFYFWNIYSLWAKDNRQKISVMKSSLNDRALLQSAQMCC